MRKTLMNNTLLIILNPRAIPECIDALRDLRGVNKAWCSYYTELELEHVIPRIIESTYYERYMILSDDTIPTQHALDTVLGLHDAHPDAVACGWVNLDSISGLATYNPAPLKASAPVVDAYSFTTLDEARSMPHGARTWFHGFVLSTMSRELALRYPFGSYHGCASDLHQCNRLQADDVPIYTSADAEVFHVKERANTLDQAYEKRLLIGERPSRVTFDMERYFIR
jgi:hypothetical protein